jgi:hypothetical protein
MRTPIQITVATGAGGSYGEPDVLYALCDDGTLWCHYLVPDEHAKGWRPIATIPQDEEVE